MMPKVKLKGGPLDKQMVRWGRLEQRKWFDVPVGNSFNQQFNTVPMAAEYIRTGCGEYVYTWLNKVRDA